MKYSLSFRVYLPSRTEPNVLVLTIMIPTRNGTTLVFDTKEEAKKDVEDCVRNGCWIILEDGTDYFVPPGVILGGGVKEEPDAEAD